MAVAYQSTTREPARPLLKQAADALKDLGEKP
jgi:hypothetical protein